MSSEFEYVFPALKGIQAGREYYISMCPMRLIPKIFIFDEEELRPELRAQRNLNKGRIPALSRYIVDNPTGYVFSAITASVDADVHFEALGEGAEERRTGILHIPMTPRFIINDGQHRRAAIEVALRENPKLGDETIGVVFFLDRGLERCQQMFADLNRHAVRPARSLNVLYDQRDEHAQIARLLSLKCSVFADMVETDKSTLSARSRKLFTLSSIYSASKALLEGLEHHSVEEAADLAIEFWEAVGLAIPDWHRVRQREMSSAEVRKDFVHSHGVVLQALGRVGNTLLKQKKTGAWTRPLGKLKKVDWSRHNASLWEGRALSAGRVSKSGQHVTLTTNLIKKQLGLTLNPEEQRVEDAFQRGAHAS